MAKHAEEVWDLKKSALTCLHSQDSVAFLEIARRTVKILEQQDYSHPLYVPSHLTFISKPSSFAPIFDEVLLKAFINLILHILEDPMPLTTITVVERLLVHVVVVNPWVYHFAVFLLHCYFPQHYPFLLIFNSINIILHIN